MNSIEVVSPNMQNMQALITLKWFIKVKRSTLFACDGSPSFRVYHPQYLQVVITKKWYTGFPPRLAQGARLAAKEALAV